MKEDIISSQSRLGCFHAFLSIWPFGYYSFIEQSNSLFHSSFSSICKSNSEWLIENDEEIDFSCFSLWIWQWESSFVCLRFLVLNSKEETEILYGFRVMAWGPRKEIQNPIRFSFHSFFDSRLIFWNSIWSHLSWSMIHQWVSLLALWFSVRGKNWFALWRSIQKIVGQERSFESSLHTYIWKMPSPW